MGNNLFETSISGKAKSSSVIGLSSMGRSRINNYQEITGDNGKVINRFGFKKSGVFQRGTK